MPVARKRTAAVRGLRLAAEHRHDAQEVVDVLHLLERLAREELRGLEIGRVVQPVTDLDAGDLAVEELVEHPLEELAVPDRVELGAPEIEASSPRASAASDPARRIARNRLAADAIIEGELRALADPRLGGPRGVEVRPVDRAARVARDDRLRILQRERAVVIVVVLRTVARRRPGRTRPSTCRCSRRPR